MYTVAIKRDFVAQHFLVGGDWGRENLKHSHHYQLELQLEGSTLDQHGFLFDILDIESNLERQVEHYRDQTLNDQPEFLSLNPSIEHFSRIVCQALAQQIKAANIQFLTVKLWENEIAWAAFRMEL